MDFFMFGCFGYIFLSIVELAIVGMLENPSDNSKKKPSFLSEKQFNKQKTMLEKKFSEKLFHGSQVTIIQCSQ